MKKNEVFNLSFCLVLFISCSYRQTAKKTRVIVEQPAAATHQSTSIQNLTFDLGQLNLSGGSSDANTSFSNLQARNRGPVLGEYEIESSGSL
ncbi:uncharacterized protein OCT59_015325 [Rhizophagus irregularis]|uniref:uncharacterized protein n=1 Tax=Rhizophagus irregularis TaxID=588596 RepID=UPI000CB11D27|nr:hypothetical protein OCT59_015325 [Rhizophagus irregularis]